MTASERAKHVPERTCIACRKSGSKRELVRLVRTASGQALIDGTGKAAGRGAYLHSNPTCWEIALKRGTIERALRMTRITPEDLGGLRSYAEALARV